MSMLVEHMKAKETSLLASAAVSANAGHTLHRGTPREVFIKDFLKEHLNSSIDIGTGEIIGASSLPRESRNQLDVVVFKRGYPRLDLGGGINAFLAESVIATIEVKSLLDREGIVQAANAAHTVKSIPRHSHTYMQIGYKPPSILSYVVAYKCEASMPTVGSWVRGVHNNLNERTHHAQPQSQNGRALSPGVDGVYILGRGYMSHYSAPVSYIQDEIISSHPLIRWELVEQDSGSLLNLFLQLTMLCSSVNASFLNPMPYLQNTQFSFTAVE